MGWKGGLVSLTHRPGCGDRRSGLLGGWAAGVGRGAVGPGAAPGLRALGGEGRASACDGRRPGAQIPAWSRPLVPSDLRRSDDLTKCPASPSSPRVSPPSSAALWVSSPLQRPQPPTGSGLDFLSPRWTQRRSPYSAGCGSPWFCLQPQTDFLGGGGDGAVGAGRFFQGWDCSQSPFPSHPPPILPPERGVATSLLRDRVSPERWEGLLG